MWDLALTVFPQVLKLFIWNIDKRNTYEKNFREWVKSQQSKAPLYVEVKDSYDAQVEELNKGERNDEILGVAEKPVPKSAAKPT